ncbi:MAG: tRNA preQ1(34) S-adenosylmethionine ribosyltransferase-isomerase QueA [Lentisphaerae bacterium]|nr:tRNA preQ1(34) S-adenosylmethionine ribosyltransferase-isomerase QueA [Lentisphaerota bacterium]
MQTSDFDYVLPPELIAQEPPAVRGSSRMMILDRQTGALAHHRVADLPRFLQAGDLLILNDTRVFPARLLGRWEDTGGAVEFLLLEREDTSDAQWRVLVGSGRRVRAGLRASFGEGALMADIVARGEGGQAVITFDLNGPLEPLLNRFGTTPLPPYIQRTAVDNARQHIDRERYQTVYARNVGAVAAPTAGLHLTEALLDQIRSLGITCATVTLHVGIGTFRPVTSETVEGHHMDAERYCVPIETADAVQACRARGGRLVAVGSTSVRTLETVAAAHDGMIVACSGRSDLFIHPPYTFRVVNAMLTNFHLPRSTLLMMVSAFAGRERTLDAYAAAIHAGYRFFSYGDCMLLQ